MDIADQEIFNQAIALAKQGHKPEANSMLKFLLQTNPLDPNLLLWTAFTSHNLKEAANLINRANLLNPANSLLPEMRNWLDKEKAKQTTSATPIRLFATSNLDGQNGQSSIHKTPSVQIEASKLSLTASTNGWDLRKLGYLIIGLGIFLLVASAFLFQIDLHVAGESVKLGGIDTTPGQLISYGTNASHTVTSQNISTDAGLYLGITACVLILVGISLLIWLARQAYLKANPELAAVIHNRNRNSKPKFGIVEIALLILLLLLLIIILIPGDEGGTLSSTFGKITAGK